MELQRIFLYGALMAILFIMWTSWEAEYAVQPSPVASSPTSVQATQTAQLESPAGFIPSISMDELNTAGPQAAVPQTEASIPESRKLRVSTDELLLTIDTLGGDIVEAKLLKYQQKINYIDNPIVLLNTDAASKYIAQSGLREVGEDALTRQQFSVAKNHYEFAPGEDSLSVVLTAKDANGLNVEKTFQFKRGSYLIGVDYKIENTRDELWQGGIYNQIVRVEPASDSSWFDIATYTGASMSDPNDKLFKKISFSDMNKKSINRTVTGGWVAMQQRYFLSAWVPAPEQTSRFYTYTNQRGEYTIGYIGAALQVKPGATAVTHADFYVGPALQDKLETIAPGLDLTVDYGILWFISNFLFWVMDYVYQFLGNWGWSIVVTTLLIKLAFYGLSAKSYRSMANMHRLAPKMQAIRERYADDKAKLSQATMDLYRKEKVNPLGGCLPILVQIPVFIALYWVLLESVHLRHAPFVLWIKDLAAPDPWFILPLLMGATMFIQQRLNPPPADPIQAKVMMSLPFVFTLLFLTFPAGLVLYWTANNGLSILQQWYITRKVAKNAASAKTGHKRLTKKAAND